MIDDPPDRPPTHPNCRCDAELPTMIGLGQLMVIVAVRRAVMRGSPSAHVLDWLLRGCKGGLP